jgi:hypothetical protein
MGEAPRMKFHTLCRSGPNRHELRRALNQCFRRVARDQPMSASSLSANSSRRFAVSKHWSGGNAGSDLIWSLYRYASIATIVSRLVRIGPLLSLRSGTAAARNRQAISSKSLAITGSVHTTCPSTHRHAQKGLRPPSNGGRRTPSRSASIRRSMSKKTPILKRGSGISTRISTVLRRYAPKASPALAPSQYSAVAEAGPNRGADPQTEVRAR